MTGSLGDITVTINSAALEARIAKLDLMSQAALDVAEDIAVAARATAPVGGADDPHSGDYRDGITAQPFKGGARVYASDYKSFWVEFGVPSRGIEPTFNLREAAVTLNYKFMASKHHG